MGRSLSEQEQPARILVVDDDQGIRKILTTALKGDEFHVYEACDGLEALEIMKQDPPDLILLDVLMPRMNGLETLQAIRKGASRVELPIIMLTVLDQVEDVVQALEAGANDYVVKPSRIEILLARVQTQLALKRWHDQCQTAITHLKRLDAAKDQFLQIAAHGLRNPLNIVMAGAALLSDMFAEIESADPEIERVIKMVEDSATTMQTIIDNYLDFQAIQAGQIELTLQDASLNDLVQTTVERFHDYAERKRICLSTELEPDLPSLRADPDRLSQAINNFVGNAIKFGPPDTHVIVRTSREGNALRFEIEDSGPGIPEDELPYLFEEFARLSNKPTGKERSSGVGLSISKHLIELHGGKVGAKSEVGVGSLFWFELPLNGEG